MKRGFIISTFTAVIMMILGISAMAQTSVKFNDSGCIEIIADTELKSGAFVSIYLNKQPVQSKDNTPSLAAVFFAGDNGEINEKIKVSTEQYSGKYYVFMGYQGADMAKSIGNIIVYDIDGAKAVSIADELENSASKSAFCSILSKSENLAEFGIDSEQESNISKAAELTYDILKAEDKKAEPRMISEILRYALCVCDIKDGENADFVIRSNAELFKSTYEEYADQKSKNTNFDEFLKKADYTRGRMSIAEIGACAKVYNAIFASELKGIIEQNSALLGIDTTSKYAKLSSANQADVFSEMLKSKALFLSKSAIAESFNSAVDKISSSSSDGSAGGASVGGGSSSSSGMPALFSPQATKKPQESESLFSDINGYFAYDAIINLSRRGIISGYSDGNFVPSGNITRAEASKVIALTFKITGASGSGFKDISENDWFYQYVSPLENNGILKGTDGYFNPNTPITREDMTVILARALKSLNKVVSGTYSFSDDGDISSYAKESVSGFAAMGIVNGYDGKFNPKANITRGEAAAIVYRIIEKSENGEFLEDTSAGEENTSYTAEFISTLFSKLGIYNEVSTNVTRGEYIQTIVGLLRFGTDEGEEIFDDVDPKSSVGGAVSIAVKCGIIPKDKSFYPDNPITVSEAARMMVNALGYSMYADQKGGYPIGHMTQATDLGLFKNLKNTAATAVLSSSDYYELMSNALDAEVCEKIIYSQSSVKTEINGRGILEICYKLYKIKGIVSANEYSYLYDSSKQTNTGEIMIDNTVYKSESIPKLGYYIEGYVHDDDSERELICWTDRRNELEKFDLCDVTLNENSKLKAEKNNKTKMYTLDKNTAVIYNGKAYLGTVSQKLCGKGDGYVEIVKRKNDSGYGLIIIHESKFMTIGTLNRIDKIIIDEKYDNKINYDDDDISLIVSGTDKGSDALSNGDVIEYFESEDKKLYNVNILKNVVSGSVAQMNEDEITVDGSQYKISDYFIKYYLNDLKLSEDLDFTLSDEGYVVSVSTSFSGYLYAYNMNVYKDASESYMIRLYTEKDKNAVYTLADKLVVNSQTYKASDCYSLLVSNIDKLVRFKTNSRGEIRCINTDSTPDTYDNPTGGENYWFDTDSVDNGAAFDGIKHYRYNENENDTMYYKSDGYFVPYFTVDDNTKIFCVVDKSVADNENNRVYLGNGKKFLPNDESVSVKDITAYNVDKTGYAAAVVYQTDSYSGPLTSESSFGIVSNMYECVDSDDEISIAIELYTNDAFATYYIKENERWYENAPKNSQGFPFEKGDLIRYTVRGGFIKDEPIRDFDAAKRTVLYDGSENSSLHYTYGKLYDYGDNSIMIIDSETGKIKCYQGKISSYGYVSGKSEISTAPTDRLITYRQSESECSNILIKCRSSRIEAYIIYE